MMENYRKGITQASLNLYTWKIIALEILFISIAFAAYMESIYVFGISLFIFLLLFYVKSTAIYVSTLFSIIWALIPSSILSNIKNVEFYSSLHILLQSPVSQVFAIIIFFIAFYLHKSTSDFFHDALYPVMQPFVNIFKGRKNKKNSQNKRNRTKIKYHKILNFISDEKVHPHNLRLFLEKNGFSLYQTNEDRNFEKKIIFNDKGIIKFYNLVETKRWITKFIQKSTSNPEKLLDTWVKFSDIALKRQVIDHLQVYSSLKFNNTKSLELLRDNEQKCYLKFKNGIVRVSSDSIVFSQYSDLSKSVFESSIIPRNFSGISKLTNPSQSQPGNKKLFEKFVEKSVLSSIPNVEKDNWRDEYVFDEAAKASLTSLKTALGYLVHSYNNPSTSKAVFFVDRFSSNGKSNGGTGKSLIISSLENILVQSKQDGKKYRDNPNQGGRFQFSNVDYETQNIFIDDLKQNFDIESIFTMVTGDIEIERKGQNKFIIPKNERPKFALTSNFPIPIKGTSYSRRIHQVELGSYWNRCINEGSKPKDEIGGELFGNNFSKHDWDDFYIFIINCVQDYLRLGLVDVQKLTSHQDD